MLENAFLNRGNSLNELLIKSGSSLLNFQHFSYMDNSCWNESDRKLLYYMVLICASFLKCNCLSFLLLFLRVVEDKAILLTSPSL